MARSVTLTTLRSRVRQRGDWENATDRVTTSEVDDAINEAAAYLHQKIIRAGGKHKRTDTSPANTSQGVATYALASDVLDVLAVRVTVSGVKAELTNYETLEESLYSAIDGGQGVPVYYQVAGDNLRFIPTPDGAYAYEYSYAPTPATLTNPSDPYDGINGLEELIVLVATKRIAFKNKEWELVAALNGEIGNEEKRVFDTVKNRDPLPPRIIDVRGIEGRALSRRRYYR